MSLPLKLIVGVGNPGERYAETRHNVGVWLVARFAEVHNAIFRDEKKFLGQVAGVHVEGQDLRLLLPSTYMNESGRSVGPLAHFYRIAPEEILVVHDELDLAIGTVRFKQGGGLAGHNGLRDISAALGGSQDFNRIRIGVGHPGEKEQVTGHVLGKASREDRELIETCIDEALRFMPLAIHGEWGKAMNALNGFRAGE